MIKLFKNIILILIQIFVIQIGYAQNLKKIEESDLLIAKTAKGAFIKLGYSEKQVIKIFGKPEMIKKGYFIKFDLKGTAFKYKGAEFYFVVHKLNSFEITNDQFILRLKGKNDYAVVGSSISSFNIKNPSGKEITIVLQNDGVSVDKVLGFTVTAKHKIIYIGCGPD